VSWPLASFLLVALVLGGGWLLYERRQPSARMVAVVATLAAVAALGRDAFVALPDVKPITAITFVVGFALGPLPGFSVGAIGMLVSNFMLGQGPYTPWQMAAWGLVGLLGAALGRLTGRRLARVPLALACALSALIAKEIMNVYGWTIGASHTPAALLIEVGRGLPFDITDTLATFLFAIAFGPELARLLARTRERMTVRFDAPSPGIAAGVVILCAVALAATLAGGGGGDARAASLARAASGTRAASLAPPGGQGMRASQPLARAASLSPEVRYLLSAQDSDGGFGPAPGEGSSELYTAWAAIALAAAGRDPATVRRAGHSVLDALRREAGTLEGPGDDERTILALHACGASSYSVGRRDLLTELLRSREPDGSIAGQVNLSAFAILALRSAGHSAAFPPIADAAGWIEHQQNPGGGFAFAARGSASDVDDTGAVLQALVAADARDRSAIAGATRYLLSAQNRDGGLPEQPGGESNAQSTAWAVQGLIAAGRNPARVHRAGSRSPLAYLETLVTPSGSVQYSHTSAQTPVWVTAEALIALARRPFPVAP
jgi:energy-coupling factor transport system substrate-specific component